MAVESEREIEVVAPVEGHAWRLQIALIDTPGAYPGLRAEERGQAEAIATNLREMSRLRVPIVAVVIGEGGSGGALAIGVGDRVAMLKYSTYSVISPEGCASILWKSAEKAEDAAEALGAAYVREEIPHFPEVSEVDVIRHYTRLSTWNYAIDLGLYPH